MKITAFPAADGDCFLVESSGGRRVLVDGGRRGPFGRHALKKLAAMRENGEELDVICVSHIDADHIEGILKMFDIEFDWLVFDAHQAADDTDFKEPNNDRPCDFAEIWHNGFQAQLYLDADLDNLPDDVAEMGEVQDLINVVADFFTGTELDGPSFHQSYANLATSVPQALELVARLEDDQMGKPINDRFGGSLITSDIDPVELDDLKITFIGPTLDTLEGLQEEWLKKFKDPEVQGTIKKLRKRMSDDVSELASGAIDLPRVRSDRVDLAAGLPEQFLSLVFSSSDSDDPIGDRGGVTAPNLASLMFVIEEGDQRAIFTGDGAWQDIIAGLEAAGFLEDEDDTIHVDVLKVQHHGAEFNLSEEFCERVTAVHYLISGDSNHGNPDFRVLEAIVNSRTPSHDHFAGTDEAGDEFFIDMAMSPEVATDAKRPGLEDTFTELDRLSGLVPGRMTVRSFDGDPLGIDLA